MNLRLQITPKAAQDLEELAFHIAEDSIEQAVRFEKAAVDTALHLIEYPEAYQVIDLEAAIALGWRKRCVRGFPNHLLFYTANSHTVVIQRCVYATRDLPAVLRGDWGKK